MVVLEAAAIGAAGYGLYKGGEIGVKKGKELHTEMKRESKRAIHRDELKEKTKSRSERISKIMSMRRGSNQNNNNNNNNISSTSIGAAKSSTSTTSASSSLTDNPSWLTGESNSFRKCGTGSTTTTTQSNNTPSVEDRHKAVMAKLRSSRREEAKKSTNTGSGSFLNPFKRK
ncbi:hypothetical protein IV203_032100 [Nitzschia inconspicua]|uniref:Uncharacterized protein n=1 Tax=Nitzschia inconspicua TaxID=303405 RepID=A0A9K3Q309_9STRA|nr:hypothetical protein IV203_032100 [Nitzschia inconspicua]